VIKIDQILKIYLVWACGSDYSAEKKNCAVSVHACINLLLHPDLPLITQFLIQLWFKFSTSIKKLQYWLHFFK